MALIDDKTLSLTPGQRIELYTVDLAIANGPILRFTPNRESLIPEKVQRITEASTGANLTIGTPILPTPAVGDILLFDGYIRQSQTTLHYPTFYLAQTAAGGAPYYRFRMNLSTLVNSGTASTNPFSTVACTLSGAGEWIYFSIRAVVGTALPSMCFGFYPAYGDVAAFPAASSLTLGSMDIFGLRGHIRRGGLLIPILMPSDMADPGWVKTATVSEVANTFEAWKVPVWQGNAYTPIPIKATGFEKTGSGAFPKPKLSMSNLTGAGSLIMQQYGDIRGAEVRRVRMYADNLDNGPDPDATAFYQPDVFTLVRRPLQDGQVIEFELASKMDQQGVSLPRRQLLRDVCPFKYRRWDPAGGGGSGAFDYSAATCPYTGSAMFDMNGDVVTAGAEDVCSHNLKTGCRKRYGKDSDIPFGGFPMVGRFRR